MPLIAEIKDETNDPLTSFPSPFIVNVIGRFPVYDSFTTIVSEKESNPRTAVLGPEGEELAYFAVPVAMSMLPKLVPFVLVEKQDAAGPEFVSASTPPPPPRRVAQLAETMVAAASSAGMAKKANAAVAMITPILGGTALRSVFTAFSTRPSGYARVSGPAADRSSPGSAVAVSDADPDDAISPSRTEVNGRTLSNMGIDLLPLRSPCGTHDSCPRMRQARRVAETARPRNEQTPCQKERRLIARSCGTGPCPPVNAAV